MDLPSVLAWPVVMAFYCACGFLLVGVVIARVRLVPRVLMLGTGLLLGWFCAATSDASGITDHWAAILRLAPLALGGALAVLHRNATS